MRALLSAAPLVILMAACTYQPQGLTTFGDELAGDSTAGHGDSLANGDPLCESEQEFCARQYPGCGTVTESDLCGTLRTEDCGCPGGESCGAGVNANVCAFDVCTAEGWCWVDPRPHGYFLYDLAGTATDLWTVGDRGVASHWDGLRWNYHFLATTEPLTTVWRFGPENVWVGGADFLAQYDGTSWQTDTTIQGIEDMAGLDDGTLVLVNGTGAIYRYGPALGAVEATTPPNNVDLHAVTCTSASQCWVAGNGGTVLSFDGTDWTDQSLPVLNDLYRIHAGATRLLVGGAGGAIWSHDDTNGWQDLSFGPSVQVTSLWELDDGRILASGCCSRSSVYDGAWTTASLPWA
ncbi:MAG: hypothetical protein JRI55_26735, partial [Deltaproteobacteria bacterium]|nr:hypothetical protein [Deltaproteobacteria bacterium]